MASAALPTRRHRPRGGRDPGPARRCSACCRRRGRRADSACLRRPGSTTRSTQAVRGVPAARGASVDGIVGPQTWRLLDEARWRLGDRVLLSRAQPPAQRRRRRGAAAATARAGLRPRAGRRHLRRARPSMHCASSSATSASAADGTCGPATFKALGRLARTVVGGAPHAHARDRGDPARRPTPGRQGRRHRRRPRRRRPRRHRARTRSRPTLAEDLAARIEGRLTAAGVARVPDPRPPGRRRARRRTRRPARRFANQPRRRPGGLVARRRLHANPRAKGVATYYYGTTDGAARSTDGCARSPARAARGHRAHRPARLRHPRQDLGPAAAHPDAGGTARARLPDQRPRRRPAGRLRRSATSWPRRSSSRCSGSTCRRTPTRPPAASGCRTWSAAQAEPAPDRDSCVAGSAPAGNGRTAPSMPLQRPVDVLAPGQRGPQVQPQPRVPRDARARVTKPTARRKSAGRTQAPAVAGPVRLDRPHAALGQVLGHGLHEHPAQTRAAVLGLDPRGHEQHGVRR